MEKERKKLESALEDIEQPDILAKATKKPAVRKEPTGKCPVFIKCKDNKYHAENIREKYLLSDSPAHAIMKDLTATNDDQLSEEIVRRVLYAMPNSESLEERVNVVFQALADCASKDSTEAKLCAQSTALYAQGMQYISKAENASLMCHVEFYMKFAIKLLRLHNETIEALSKYRRGGEQRVVVQHVQVNDGGQAIVGSVLNGGGANKNNEVTP